MIRSLVCSAAVLWLGACASAPPSTTGGCDADADCDGAMACVDGTCRNLCNSDSDCPAAESCNTASGVCELVNSECAASSDCTAAGARCAASPSATCQGGTCYCGDCAAAAECNDANDCTADDCVNGGCVNDGSTRVGAACDLNGSGDGKCALFGSSGVCTYAIGAACTAHSDCGFNYCECANVACTTRVCAVAACVCGYDASGGCTNNLATGTQDPEDCAGTTACFAGVCMLANGEACADDAACGGGHCECAGSTCTTRICHSSDCPCQYVSGGICAGYLLDGTNEPGSCDGSQSCFQGACLLDIGQACTDDGDCGTLECECTNSTCTAMVCAQSDCVCMFGANGTCINPVQNGPNDPFDCSADCVNGQCTTPLGGTCTADAQCQQGQCECNNATCTTGICNLTECICGYGSGGNCLTDLPQGTEDIGDCFGGWACYKPVPADPPECRVVVGATCGQDSDCGYGHCECADATCGARVCALADCVCGFGIDGSCTGALTDGSDDAQDCDAAGWSCWGGACLVDDGAGCTDDADCRSGNCFAAVCQTNRCDDVAIAAVPYSGSGTTLDPYLICTAAQLHNIGANSSHWSAVFQLAANLDLSGYDGLGGNPNLNQINNFSGTFDGRGYELDGLTKSSGNGVGLFNNLQSTGGIMNLWLTNVDVNGSSNIGAVVGSNAGGQVTNCHVTGAVRGNNSNVGGVVGYNTGMVSGCSASVTMTTGNSLGALVGVNENGATIEASTAGGAITNPGCCPSQVGGLVGTNNGTIRDSGATTLINVDANDTGGLVGINRGTVVRCSATGDVTSQRNTIGGLVGRNEPGSAVLDSYATGLVIGTGRVGGLVGENRGSISRTYARGEATATSCDNVAGLVGRNFDPVVNSFATGRVTGNCSSAGLIGDDNSGGSGVSNCFWYDSDAGDDAMACWNLAPSPQCATEPSLPALYLSSHPVYGGWDFATVWQESPSTLPTLRP